MAHKNKNNELSKEQKEILANIPFESGGFVDIADSGSDEGFIIMNNNNKISKAIFKWVKRLLIFILMAIFSFSLYLCFSYKLVPLNVKGSVLDISNFSIISRYAEADVEHLKVGDVILVKDPEYSDWLPIVTNFNIYSVTGREGHWIFCKNSANKKETIQSPNIIYILKDNALDNT